MTEVEYGAGVLKLRIRKPKLHTEPLSNRTIERRRTIFTLFTEGNAKKYRPQKARGANVKPPRQAPGRVVQP